MEASGRRERGILVSCHSSRSPAASRRESPPSPGASPSTAPSIVDADQIVRDVQQPGSPVLAAIAAEFGSGMLRPDGSLDRAALGAVVFGDAAAVGRLNAIVHPAVRAESARRFSDAMAANPEAVVVYDVPLLVEARADDPWDLIVVAHAPADVRRQRLVELRGMTESDAAARLASQVSDDVRLALADVVVDTARSLPDTEHQVDDLWKRLHELVAERAAPLSRARPAVANTARMSVAPPTLDRCRPLAPYAPSKSSANTSRRATSLRRSPSSPPASTPVRRMSCCSARPAPASPRRRRGSSSRCSGRPSCSRTTRRSPRSWPTSSAS